MNDITQKIERFSGVLNDMGIETHELDISFKGIDRISNATLREYVENEGWTLEVDHNAVTFADVYIDTVTRSRLVLIPTDENRPDWAEDRVHQIVKMFAGDGAMARMRVLLELIEIEGCGPA